MAAVSRFVEFSIVGQTHATGASTDTHPCYGTRGYSQGTNLGGGADSFTILANDEDQMKVTINTVAHDITLTSGTDLDPRFVARDIAFQLHQEAPGDDNFRYAQCHWRNGTGLHDFAGGAIGTNDVNCLIIYSGQMGSNTSANDVNVSLPTTTARDCRGALGFDTPSEGAGYDYVGTYAGTPVVSSGTYGGQFDDYYTVQISDGELVGDPSPTGTYAGTPEAGGVFIGGNDDTYTLTIAVAGRGPSMGAGTTQVPAFTVGSTYDNNSSAIELLYPDHWYDVGAFGVRVRFSDSPFADGDTFTINAFTASGTGGDPGTAKYVWDSIRGDSSKIRGLGAVTTSDTISTQVGTKGATIGFEDTGSFAAGDLFGITCIGPQPLVEDATQLNFGNVTVSTASAVKVVWFELISGAVSMSTVKFSLQNHGAFQHHEIGNDDTYFHWGTVGAGNPALGVGGGANDQVEWPVDATGAGKIVASDIEDTNEPNYLYATDGNLLVVASADDAKTIGNYLGAAVSDFIYLAVKLGADETGANSTINYRMFFDFS